MAYYNHDKDYHPILMITPDTVGLTRLMKEFDESFMEDLLIA